MPSEEKEHLQLLQGTLDLIVLRTLATMGAQHAYQIATRLQQVSEDLLNLNQGTLYPALVRLEQYGWIKGAWGRTESNREAKFYSITKPGEKALDKETWRWARMAGAGWQGWWTGCWWRNPSREVSQTFSYQVHRLVSQPPPGCRAGSGDQRASGAAGGRLSATRHEHG